VIKISTINLRRHQTSAFKDFKIKKRYNLQLWCLIMECDASVANQPINLNERQRINIIMSEQLINYHIIPVIIFMFTLYVHF